MDAKYFAEGLTYARGKLYQLTYHANKGFIYDINDLSAPPEEFAYQTSTGEGKQYAIFSGWTSAKRAKYFMLF